MGINVVFHVLGPALLALVPLLSLLLICLERRRSGHVRTLQVPTFVLVVASMEAVGLHLGIEHHGVMATLVLAVIGIVCSCLSIAAGATIVFLVRRTSRRVWPNLPTSTYRVSLDREVARGRFGFDTVSLRGPPQHV